VATFLKHRGEPIMDVVEWCRAHGDEVVKYRVTTRTVNPLTGEIETYTEEETMPRSFYNTLRRDEHTEYEEIL